MSCGFGLAKSRKYRNTAFLDLCRQTRLHYHISDRAQISHGIVLNGARRLVGCAHSVNGRVGPCISVTPNSGTLQNSEKVYRKVEENQRVRSACWHGCGALVLSAGSNKSLARLLR